MNEQQVNELGKKVSKIIRSKSNVREKLLKEFPDGQIPYGSTIDDKINPDGIIMMVHIDDFESHNYKHPTWWFGSAEPRSISRPKK